MQVTPLFSFFQISQNNYSSIIFIFFSILISLEFKVSSTLIESVLSLVCKLKTSIFSLSISFSVIEINSLFSEFSCNCSLSIFHISTGSFSEKELAIEKEKIIRKSYLTDYSLFRDDIFSPLIEDIKNELLLTWIDLTKQSDEVYRFKFVYDIENISDWVELQNRLQSVRLLEQYKPSLFTTDKVEGYVDFLGNGDKFVLLLSQNKINAVNLGPYYRISLDD